MNLGEMKITTVADFLGEADSSGNPIYDRFSEAEVTRRLNRALEDLAGETGYCTSEATWATTANEEEIPYPSDAIEIFRIEYNNEELEKTSRDKLDEEDADWEAADTGPPEKWYPDRNMTYALQPKPDAVYTITVYYFSVDDTLSGASDVPNIPTAWHEALCMRAAAQAKAADGEIVASRTLMSDYRDIIEGRVKKVVTARKHKSHGVRIKMASWTYSD